MDTVRCEDFLGFELVKAAMIRIPIEKLWKSDGREDIARRSTQPSKLCSSLKLKAINANPCPVHRNPSALNPGPEPVDKPSPLNPKPSTPLKPKP